MSNVALASAALTEHMERYRGQLLMQGTFAGDEFDRLYLVLIRARWDAGDKWVRTVWTVRP